MFRSIFRRLQAVVVRACRDPESGYVVRGAKGERNAGVAVRGLNLPPSIASTSMCAALCYMLSLLYLTLPLFLIERVVREVPYALSLIS
jgi:hypothetical protein